MPATPEPFIYPIPEAQPDPEPLPDPIPEPQTGLMDITPYLGRWKGVAIATSGLILDPDKLGIDMWLTLNADGTGELIYMLSDGGSTWHVTNGQMIYNRTPLVMLEDGQMRYQTSESEYMQFKRAE